MVKKHTFKKNIAILRLKLAFSKNATRKYRTT